MTVCDVRYVNGYPIQSTHEGVNVNNAAQASTEALEECTRTTALETVLDQCSDTVWELFHALNFDGCNDEQAESSTIASPVQRLYRQLDAAHNLSCVIDASDTGWPTDQSTLATFTGPRSGCPVDLITGIFDQTRGCCGLACGALGYDGKCDDPQVLKHGGALASAVWGIQMQIGSVKNIIGYDTREQ